MADATRNPQLDVIESLDCPVIVQAGAGSGKTYTLTERIVNALAPSDGSAPFTNSIENIVAITFTTKAAEELKSRVRERLEQAGRHDQALLVDDAYISTIHSFAGRILRENALAFEIDPEIQIIDADQEAAIMNGAIESAILNLISGDSIVEDIIEGAQAIAANGILGVVPTDPTQMKKGDFKEITAEENFANEINEMLSDELSGVVESFVQTQTSAFYSNYLTDSFFKDGRFSKKDLVDSIKKICEQISSIPNFEEASSFFYGTPLSFEEILSSALKLVQTVIQRVSFDLDDKYQGPLYAKFVDAAAQIEDFLQADVADFDDFEYAERAISVYSSVPVITYKSLKNSDDGDVVEAYNCDLANLTCELLAMKEYENLRVLVTIALAVTHEVEKIKGVSYLTNNDVQRVCYEKLLEHPRIAERYREKFALIMVDEFQDTDNLQLDLIGILSRGNFENVCTVGDIQQSIYRFRGADVNVFRRYKDSMLKADSGVKVVDLPNNFRSHRDVLALTDAIFAPDEMFGNEFLHLVAKGNVNNEPDARFDTRPRVKVRVNNFNPSARKDPNEKVTSVEAIEYQAELCAKHLKEIKQASGDKHPGSMAVILSRLQSGGDFGPTVEIGRIYQQKLLNVGLEAVITGGSSFARSDEVALILTLLSVARNIFDSEALFSLLQCDFFDISDDALLKLSKYFDDESGHFKPRTVSDGFSHVDEDFLSTLSSEDAAGLSFAHEAIFNLINCVRFGSVEYAIRAFLAHVGYFDDLDARGADGLVSAGNIEKCFCYLRSIQQETNSISLIFERFAGLMAAATEKPAILSTIESDFVEIMTVHASKGLQFDHVVVGEIKDGTRSYPTFLMAQSGERGDKRRIQASKIGSVEGISLSGYINNSETFGDQNVLIHDAMTVGELYRALLKQEQKENFEEAKRVLYVALTRAVKSLLLLVKVRGKDCDSFEDAGIWTGVYHALNWDENCTPKHPKILHVGDSDIEVTYELLTQEVLERDMSTSEGDDDEETETQKFVLRPHRQYPYVYSYKHRFDEFISYSTIAKFSDTEAKFIGKQISPLELNDDSRGNENEFWKVDEDRATDFGSKMHSALELMVNTGCYDIVTKDERLSAALSRIVGYKEMFFDGEAEVPFCVKIGNRYLRGAFDLFKAEGDVAHVVDYKSGTAPKSHDLQAKVYGYALLKTGYKAVRIDFLHAEVDLVQSFDFDDASAIEDDIFKEIEATETELAKEIEADKVETGPQWAQ